MSVSVRLFGPLMRQRVTTAPRTAFDDVGSPTYGTRTTHRAAVVGEMAMVRDAHGQQVPSHQAVYLMSNAAVRPGDLVVLSTGDVGSTESYAISPPILAVERYPFLRGQFATVLRLGGRGGV